MQIEEIRDNAPDGATHYVIIKGLVIYFKVNKWVVEIFSSYCNDWLEDRFYRISELKPLH
ncbi:hypothetical protein [Acinetobacter phage HFM1]|nr:hypothetical protein [Acinetobacter phage HFM1]